MLYIITDSNKNYKIGVTGDMSKRLPTLQTSNAGKLTVVYTVTTKSLEEDYKLEKKLHQELSEYRLLGEWFSCDCHVIIDLINTLGYNMTVLDNRTVSINIAADVTLLDLMKELSTSEIALVSTSIKYAYEVNNNTIRFTDYRLWTKYLADALMKNYKHLEELGILMRISRGVYMINPYLVTVDTNTREEDILKWNNQKDYR